MLTSDESNIFADLAGLPLLNILWTGWHLITASVDGLMDTRSAHPSTTG